jgi:DNA processing protein
VVTEREVAAATLASLPLMTASRLRRMLDACRSPEGALAAVQAGQGGRFVGRCIDTDPAALAKEWRAVASAPDTIARQLRERRTHVWIADDDGYPIGDPLPDRPPVLLGEGERTDAFDAARVAIVGTRSASPQGLADARELGAFLGDAGVTVVSGLAIGIDGAAHQGALDAGGLTVGVVATGLDITYPRRHRDLYARVREHGLVVSEHGYGVQPRGERFPPRNRIIAALADVVVVVEAGHKGGALITARYAGDYGRTLFALPGSRRNLAAVGSNALIADGAVTLLEPADLLIALGRGGSRPGPWDSARLDPPSDAAEVAVLRALAGEPASAEELERRTRLGPAGLGGALTRLERAGRLGRQRGLWWPL